MKIVTLVARLLMGIAFVVFGFNGFLHFIPQPTPPPGLTRDFFMVMFGSHYILLAFAIQIVSGGLFLANRYVTLALALVAPVIVNILLFHLTLSIQSIPPAIIVTACWFVVFAAKRTAFAALADPTGV